MTPSESTYGKIAIEAHKKAAGGMDARIAWETTAANALAHSPTGVRKSCPKMAFVSLAYAGQIVGVQGEPEKSPSANGDYALAALKLLRQESSYHSDPAELWQKVMALLGVKKKHNSQMNVVIALWNERLFNDQSA